MSVILESENPRGILLFAPGAGGDPTRYERLLAAANAAGFVVASPEHELTETFADDEVRERVVALRSLLDDVALVDLPVVAAGHSLGGFAALCLAGAHPRNRAGEAIEVPSEPRVERAVVIAPATGWFSGEDGLTDVQVPVAVLVGGDDAVTPPGTAEILRTAPSHVEVISYEGVGHFDFMSPLPEGKTPVVEDHEAFTERFLADFVAALG